MKSATHSAGSSCARTSHDGTSHHCDAALVRAFSFLGKRWNGVILGSLVYGEAGFSELKRRVEGISDSVLSDRLSELQDGRTDCSNGPVGSPGVGDLRAVVGGLRPHSSDDGARHVGLEQLQSRSQ